MDDGIDRSQWRLDDPEWVKKREEDWPKVKAYFENKDPNWLDDMPKEKEGDYEKFFKTGARGRCCSSWVDLSVMMPEPTIDEIRSLIKLAKVGGGYRLPYHGGMSTLVEQGVISEKHVTNKFFAYAGVDYEELCRIQELDIEVYVPIAVQEIFPWMSKWIQSLEPIRRPIELFLPHFTTVAEYISDENIADCEFYVIRHCRRLRDFEENHPSIPTDEQRETVEILKAFLKSDKVNECVREIAARHF